MFKSIKILGLCLLTFLLLMSACGNQSNNDSSTDEMKTEDPAISSSGDDDTTDCSSIDDSSIDDSTSDLSEERADRVLNATLEVLSEDGYTTVDFTNKTATRDGRKMNIEIVETEDDFKGGLVREKIDDTQSHTLYTFEFHDNNKINLIEPATLEVIYSE